MKSINKIILNNARVVFETSYFKMSLILTLIMAIYGGYLSSKYSYIEGFISILSYPIFFVFGILIPFLTISLCTYSLFDKNEYFISRLKSKKEYLKNLILTVFVVNTFVYILMLVTILIALNLFPKTGLGFKYNSLLHCHNFIYLIFVTIRLFCIIQSLSIFSILLCKIINPRIVIGLNMVLYGSFIAWNYGNINAINSVFDIPLFIGNYLIVSKYDSFGLELLCTILFISFLIILNCGQFLITKKRLGDIKI